MGDGFASGNTEDLGEKNSFFPLGLVIKCLFYHFKYLFLFLSAVELVRSAYDEDGRYDKLLEEKTDKEDLVAIFDSLNFLGSCAWRTNKRILDIAIRMFNSGGNEDLAIPGPVVQPETDIKLPK